MITPIQSNGANTLNNALNVERIRVPRRLSFKGMLQTEQPKELQQKQDTFVKQAKK